MGWRRWRWFRHGALTVTLLAGVFTCLVLVQQALLPGSHLAGRELADPDTIVENRARSLMDVNSRGEATPPRVVRKRTLSMDKAPAGDRKRQREIQTRKGLSRDEKSSGGREVRVLCWIMTDEKDLENRTRHVQTTWGKRCDVTLYMSSTENRTFPTVGLGVPPGRDHIAAKARAAWSYVFQHHLGDADFFLKADPDTYVVVDNLRAYLKTHDPEEAEYFGHAYKHVAPLRYTYMSGGSGLVMSREALKLMVTRAFQLPYNCLPDGQGEDWKTAGCLYQVGATAVDTRDPLGRETFLVFSPLVHLHANYPSWYKKRHPLGLKKGMDCCSDYPISFHYIKPEEMYQLDYFIYHVRPRGGEVIRGGEKPLRFMTR